MLDKYIGDAIRAVFGTAVSDVSDADNALMVATERLRELARFARATEPTRITVIDWSCSRPGSHRMGGAGRW